MTDEHAQTPILGRRVASLYLLRCLSTCKIASMSQVARIYSYSTQADKRARELVKHLRDDKGLVETWRASTTSISLIRLSAKARRELGGMPTPRFISDKTEHKLAVTDLYFDLGMPEDFITEYRVAFEYNGRRTINPDAYSRGVFWEIQRSPMESRRWTMRCKEYEQFFASWVWRGLYAKKPIVVIVQSANQQHSTIGSGKGYVLHVIRDIREILPEL